MDTRWWGFARVSGSKNCTWNSRPSIINATEHVCATYFNKN